MGWFRSDTFKEATKLAKVTGRSFYPPTRRPDPAAASPGSTASGHDTRQPGPRRHPPPGLATSRGPCTDGLCRHDTHADA